MTFEHAIQTGIPSPVLVTPHHSQAKGKDLSLELLKFVAMILILKSASNLNGNLNGSKELEHYAS